MPAPRKPNNQSLVSYLTQQARVPPVSHSLPLTKYYRTADLLQAQAAAYRVAHNEEQLYVMLLRLIGLVVETIPKHKSYAKASPLYQKYEQSVKQAFAEAEQLKTALQLRDIQPTAHTNWRPSNTVQITDTDALPDIDWAGASAPPAAAAKAAAAGIATGYIPLDSGLEWPPRPDAGAAGGAAGQQQQQWDNGYNGYDTSVTYSSSYAPSSQQTAQKHALFAPRSSSSSSSSMPPLLQQNSRPRYPTFDSTPIDALWSQSSSSSTSAAAAAADGIGSLSLSDRQQQQQSSGSFLDAAMPQPSAGPSLGPQEVEVQSMQPCGADAAATCAVEPVSLPSVQEAAAAAAAGPKSLSKKIDLRDVHISVALMNDFLHYAANCTRRGIESCGILAGRLSATDSRFTVTTLIVPKQTGTSDTVEMLGEEEVWEAESSRELVPLGWIHTHPTQTCFLSSVDIHTQCGYQTMLDEAVAIVMAPTDSRKRCGIFRLTTPVGLEQVQKCPYRGFHAACNSEMYELCGHVYLNPTAKHEVIDLR